MSESPGAKADYQTDTVSSGYILVVDDEAQIRDLISGYLTKGGYDCLSAATAEDALALTVAHPEPALVLTDIRMPGVGGVELLLLL